jgi:hypothetical protein
MRRSLAFPARLRRAAGMCLAASVVIGGPVEGQSRLRSEVDTTLITVGDRITLTVEVEHGADASVVWPDSMDLSPFEVLGARLRSTTTEGDRATSVADFSLTAFELGALEVPSFEVELLRADGEREVLRTDRFGIEVSSVGADETGDIREIRGPLAIPISPARVAVWALLLMALGAALWAALRRWKDSRVPAAPVELAPPPRPAHEVALEALERLAASPLLERGEVKEFHIEASEILRRYVEAVFLVPALEMTTGEIMGGLERAEAPGEARLRLRRLLDQCDLVKFAKVRPDADGSRAVVDLGREIVELSIGWVPRDARAAEVGLEQPAGPAVEDEHERTAVVAPSREGEA